MRVLASHKRAQPGRPRLRRGQFAGLLGVGLLGAGLLGKADPAVAAPSAPSVLVPPAVMHAVEGLSFGNDGMLYGASVHGQSLYRIDPRRGRVTIAVGPPDGEADDVAIGPAGTPVADVFAWTAQRSGEIRIRRPGAAPEVAMSAVPRVNPIAFDARGRLFMAQVGAGEDSLWELDLVGGGPPRRIAHDQGRLNGFGFGPDGRLYAPLFGTDRLVAIDVDTGIFTTVASGVGNPSAAKPDGAGHLYSVDYLKGDVWRTELATGSSQIIGSFPAPLDNLALGPDGLVYVSSTADSRIYTLDPATGASHELVAGWFTIPLGMSFTRREGHAAILVADPFGYRYVDLDGGRVTRPAWAANRGASSAIAANGRFIAFDLAGSPRVREIDRDSDLVVFESSVLAAPRGLALSSAGELIVADAASGRVVRLGPNGAETLAQGLRHPVGLALESDRVALVTEYEGGTLSRVNLATGTVRAVARGLDHPTGVALLRSGRWAVVEPGRGRLLAIDARSGTRTTLARGLALALDRLDLPEDTNAGLAVDADGAVYVSCPGNNSIVKIGAPGTRPERARGDLKR